VFLAFGVTSVNSALTPIPAFGSCPFCGPKPALAPGEVSKVLTETAAGVDHFRVEVCGWDQEEIFFVEKSHLAWDEIVGKHISLRLMLPEGAIVFVRVLQAMALRQSPRMAYKVEFITVVTPNLLLGLVPEAHGRRRLRRQSSAQIASLDRPLGATGGCLARP
jgi:hypothetical protein